MNKSKILQQRLNLIGSFLSKYLNLNFIENHDDKIIIIDLESHYYSVSLEWNRKTCEFMSESYYVGQEIFSSDKNPFKAIFKVLEQIQMINNKINGEISVKFLRNLQFLK
jgi:hypothetical protein